MVCKLGFHSIVVEVTGHATFCIIVSGAVGGVCVKSPLVPRKIGTFRVQFQPELVI